MPSQPERRYVDRAFLSPEAIPGLRGDAPDRFSVFGGAVTGQEACAVVPVAVPTTVA